eukprot:9469862-Pyramimonas_sp.AAC.1
MVVDDAVAAHVADELCPERGGVHVVHAQSLVNAELLLVQLAVCEVDPLTVPFREAVCTRLDRVRHHPLQHVLGQDALVRRGPAKVWPSVGCADPLGDVLPAHELHRLALAQRPHAPCGLHQLVLAHLDAHREERHRARAELEVRAAAAGVVEVDEGVPGLDRGLLQGHALPAVLGHPLLVLLVKVDHPLEELGVQEGAS